MLPRTNFHFERTYKEDGAWTTEHKINQFVWHRDFIESGLKAGEEAGPEKYLSAIVFSLYESAEDIGHGFPPALTVYGNGRNLCRVHFQGRKCFEKIFYFSWGGLEIYDIPPKEDFCESVQRTEVHPPPFLASGSYPPHGFRKYEIEISKFRKDSVRVVAGVSPEPEQCNMEVLLVPEGREPLEIAKIKKSGSFWVPEENVLEPPTVTLTPQNPFQWLRA